MLTVRTAAFSKLKSVIEVMVSLDDRSKTCRPLPVDGVHLLDIIGINVCCYCLARIAEAKRAANVCCDEPRSAVNVRCPDWRGFKKEGGGV